MAHQVWYQGGITRTFRESSVSTMLRLLLVIRTLKRYFPAVYRKRRKERLEKLFGKKEKKEASKETV